MREAGYASEVIEAWEADPKVQAVLAALTGSSPADTLTPTTNEGL